LNHSYQRAQVFKITLTKGVQQNLLLAFMRDDICELTSVIDFTLNEWPTSTGRFIKIDMNTIDENIL